MINIGLIGSNGKMGQTIIQRIDKFSSCRISAKFNSSDDITKLDDFCKNSDVIIDFSHPDMLNNLLHCALIHQIKLVIGTTGITMDNITAIQEASKTISVLYSPNMSIGANLIATLSKISATILPYYDVEIIEHHHRDKKDAPSGTAIMLAKEVAKTKNLEFDKCAILNRHERHRKNNKEIGIASIRGGKIHGKHEVFFLGDDETISLKHEALNRNSFADGAIIAAKWINDKKPGLYSMEDIFEFSSQLI